MIKGILIKNLKVLKKEFDKLPILIPNPKFCDFLESGIGSELSSNSSLGTFNIDDNLIFLEELREFLGLISKINLQTAVLKQEEGDLFKNVDYNSFLEKVGEESYILEIKRDYIQIYGIHEKGVFYGVQTLIQILKNCYLNKDYKIKDRETINSLILPSIKIKDYPDLKIRGIADDIARGQVFSIESAKNYLRLLSHYKINFYFLYLEDMYSHPKYPDIGKERGALTREELKDLDSFAQKRFIELVPIFQCLGHVDNILIHKKYEYLGEFPGAKCYDISNPETYSFLNDYITDLSELFSTKFFHIGCDETFDVGKFRSKELFAEKGKEALISHYDKVYQLALKAGNEQIIMYDDFIRDDKEILQKLNKNLILMYWDYSPNEKYPKIKQHCDKGFKVIASPSMLNWQRIFPNYSDAAINIINLALEAYENKNSGCLGLLTSNWGDYRYYTLRVLEYFGGVLTAGVSWTTADFKYEQFLEDYAYLYYGLRNNDIIEFVNLFSSLVNLNSFFKAEPQLIFISFYMYFFKHPFPTKTFTPPINNHYGLEEAAKKCLNLYNKLLKKIAFKREEFEYLEFCAQIAKVYSEKLNLSLELSNSFETMKVNHELRTELISKLEGMNEKILKLKDQYEKLWLRAAKRPCLDQHLHLFDFLIEKYKQKAEQLREKTWFKDPYIKSEWIWIDEKRSPIEPRYFRKNFVINQIPKKAIIHGSACTYMKIYVNGELIGSVSGRTTFAILPILYRTRIFDITNLLKKGKNIIAIEAYNFEYYKGAINLYGQILLEGGNIQEILSDTSWKGFKEDLLSSNQWLNIEFNDSEWSEVISYGRPPNVNGDIFEPDLLNGEKSITQDYFGIESHEYDLLKQMLGKRGEKRIEKMISQAYKIMNPFG